MAGGGGVAGAAAFGGFFPIGDFQPLHAFSTFGSWMLGAAFLVMLYNLLNSLKNGERAPKNPWGGLSLEWETESPPVTENFEHVPHVEHGPYDYAATAARRAS